jgi:hypothetical protein
MSRSAQQAPAEPTAGSVTTLLAKTGPPRPVPKAKRRRKRGTKGPVHARKDAVAAVRACNAQSEAHADLHARTRQASDTAARMADKATDAKVRGSRAAVIYRTSQAEHPERRAPLSRQVAIAVAALGLDAIACYFAAQALGSSRLQTTLWTALFLAALAAGEVALDRLADRNRKAWRGVAVALLLFVIGLAALRFEYFSVTDVDGPVAALVAASLFTAFTIGFLAVGYRALRAAQPLHTWQASRWARKAAREAEAAASEAARYADNRDRLLEAYLTRIRPLLMETCTAAELSALEQAIRMHLRGEPS